MVLLPHRVWAAAAVMSPQQAGTYSEAHSHDGCLGGDSCQTGSLSLSLSLFPCSLRALLSPCGRFSRETGVLTWQLRASRSF